MDFKKNIPEIEKKIKYTFKDKSLLTQAFTRSSFCNENRGTPGGEYISNEILEFFGDSVLSTVIVSMLLSEKTRRYEHGLYTELDEGDFSNIRSKLSDKRNLSTCMAELGLQRFLIMGEGDEKLGIENEPSVMEDLFESIIGAVYVDCGMDISKVTKTVTAMLDVKAYFSESAPPIQSYKNALQEWCADKKHRLPAPVYRTVGESGPDHKRVYERAVIIGDRKVAVGCGKNLKLADAAAAEAALEILKNEKKEASVPVDAIARLREYAAKKKQPSPEFRDLGETPASTSGKREYIIECRLMGMSASGIGSSKQDARALAAQKLLDAISEKEKPKSEPKSEPKGKTAQKPPLKRITIKHLGNEKVAKKLSVKEQGADGEAKKLFSHSFAKNAKKSDKAASPKKSPFQHKKHL